MRKFLFLLLVFFTSFQLTGGFAVLAAWGPAPAQAIAADGQQTVSEKHFNPFNSLVQLIKAEEKEEGYGKHLAYLPFLLQDGSSFVPVFSTENKHFLIHYAASIKGKLPTLHLLHNIFRL